MMQQQKAVFEKEVGVQKKIKIKLHSLPPVAAAEHFIAVHGSNSTLLQDNEIHCAPNHKV